MRQIVHFTDLGLIDFKKCWDYQEKLFNEVVDKKTTLRNGNGKEAGATHNYLLFCEHPHVYTIGKSGKEQHLLLNSEELKEKQAGLYKINRGGDITYHGPGQAVGYPILDLENFFTDIGKYLRYLEETVIRTLAEYGIIGGRIPTATGVWVDAELPLKARKICAIGVRTSRWVTMHGFALNINTDMNYFKGIIPCGIEDKAVTSMAQELNRYVDMLEVKEKLKTHFSELFEAELHE